MYPTDDFVTWFACSFGAEVPDDFHHFLNRYPRGTSGECGCVYPPGEIVSNTEERQLVAKGVCLIGRTSTQRDILLRVRDGKVFVVDEADHRAVDATFSGMAACSRLLALGR
jgi:hypothetical protein